MCSDQRFFSLPFFVSPIEKICKGLTRNPKPNVDGDEKIYYFDLERKINKKIFSTR